MFMVDLFLYNLELKNMVEDLLGHIVPNFQNMLMGL